MSYPDNIQFRRLLLHKTSPAEMTPRLGSFTTKILRYHFQSNAFFDWIVVRNPFTWESRHTRVCRDVFRGFLPHSIRGMLEIIAWFQQLTDITEGRGLGSMMSVRCALGTERIPLRLQPIATPTARRMRTHSGKWTAPGFLCRFQGVLLLPGFKLKTGNNLLTHLVCREWENHKDVHRTAQCKKARHFPMCFCQPTTLVDRFYVLASPVQTASNTSQIVVAERTGPQSALCCSDLSHWNRG